MQRAPRFAYIVAGRGRDSGALERGPARANFTLGSTFALARPKQCNRKPLGFHLGRSILASSAASELARSTIQ